MVRTVYLIRHAHQAAPDEQRRCISRTNLPLDGFGRAQAQRLAAFFREHPAASVYTSPLLRAKETAQHIADGRTPVIEDNRLAELDVGDWEGLTFDEIQRRWPEEYAARGAHMGTTAPPGGESFVQAGERLGAFLSSLPCENDIIVVSHGGILRGWLCAVLGLPPDEVLSIRQPRGGITAAVQSGSHFEIKSLGLMPVRFPDDAETERLYNACKTPENVRQHCRAVAQCAMEICDNLDDAAIDRAFLRAAALLHDLCRTERKLHPQLAAQKLDVAGYPELGEIIRQHHSLPENTSPEAELLCLADLLTDGTERVTIRQRFEKSRQKCRDEAAEEAWTKRYERALALERSYLCETFSRH